MEESNAKYTSTSYVCVCVLGGGATYHSISGVPENIKISSPYNIVVN